MVDTISELEHLWDFEPGLTETSEIFCPECKEYSHWQDWAITEVGCEDCGTHDALRCPECEETFDHTRELVFDTFTG